MDLVWVAAEVTSTETPHSLAEKKFGDLQPLTPGSRYRRIFDFIETNSIQ